MTLTIILLIIVIHWFADFVCQTHLQAINKSKNWLYLLSHTTVYSIIWFAISCIYSGITNNTNILWFAPITFIAHTITDYYTSRVNSQLWKDEKIHDFFVAIGFDQVLHYFQLYITFYLLTK